MRFPAVLVLVLMAPQAQARLPSVSAATDPAWTPMLGCWELHSQSVNNVELETPPGQLVCLRHIEGGPGVEVLTVEDGRLVPKDSFVADGVRRELSPVPPCRGWQQARWSSDGQRLYVSSELSCAQGPARASSAVNLMSVLHEWVEIRRLRFAERSQVAVRRFLPASPEDSAAVGMSPGGAAPLSVATSMTVNDLLEASQQLEPEAVEALLLETGFRGRVDAEGLGRLATAGVDDGVIDLVVALSFPDRFVIERGGMVLERLKQEDQPRVVYSSSYVSPWPWWGYHPWSSWWYWYPVQPVPPPGGGTPPYAERGVAVKGKGYTRARVTPTEPGGGGLGKAVARSRGASGQAAGSGSDHSGTDSSGSSGDGAATTGGYTGGGSSGRTAVPRPKGDGR